MHSYSIETQQNANSQPENSKIAEIYQRMLLGEKSSLAHLQQLKTHNPKQFIHARPQSDQESSEFTRKKSMNRTEVHKTTENHSAKESPFDRIKTINEEPLEESMFREKDKQQEKLRSYIKKKVNELRSEKEVMRNQEEREMNEIKKINNNIKASTANQSRSYDLVKRKQLVHKTANSTNAGMSVVKEQAKRAFESISMHEGIKKVPSSLKSDQKKQLPPLKKKIPTQNSQQNQELSQSKAISRKDIITPINLAQSCLKVQLKSAESQETKKRESPSKVSKESAASKKQESRVKKISLPQMRRMRQEFALINQQQKSAQLDMMQCHQQTKNFIEEVRVRYQLNYRNADRLNDMKKSLNPEPVLTTLKTIPSSLKKEQSEQEAKNKKPFRVHEQKIEQASDDIKLIEEAIGKKKQQLNNLQTKLSQNLLAQFWNSHDLQQHDFADDDDSLSQFQVFHPQNMSDSKLTEAYSTAMPQTKDKKWKRKAIKQYDSNRSFQEYAKSRSQFRANPIGLKDSNSLNQIDQTEQDEIQDLSENRVTVNSRLKKLLLQ